MRNTVFVVLAAAGISCSTAFAAISPTGDATNVTEQIQAAIDAAPNGTVTLAAGTYSIIRAITISNGASLVGGGTAPGDVVLSLATRTKEDGNQNVVRIENSPHTVVSNLTVTAKDAVNGNTEFGPNSGIAMDSGLVVDCLITDIKTKNGSMYGGGVNISGGTVRGCTITKCEAVNSSNGVAPGEAVYMTGGLVENCVIVSNAVTYTCGSHDWAGGTVYMSGGTLRGCLIADNVGDRNASGVAVQDGVVESCTIAGNRQLAAESDAHGVWVKSNQNGNIVLRNNIVWDNTAFDGSVANVRFVSSSGCTFEYNDSKPLVSGVGNVSVSPAFVDVENGDYRPRYSFCTDAGLNQAWMTGAFDLDGNERIRNGTVDMGCYEGETPSGFACRMSLSSDEVPNLSTVELVCEYSGGLATQADWTFWRQQDLEQVTVSGFTTTVQLPAGTWNLRLKVYGSGNTAELEEYGAVAVRSTIVYAYEKGTGRFPYDTVEKGLPSINQALQVLGVGGTLYVAEGTYVISNGLRLVEGRGSRIESLAGPEKTIVRLADVTTFNNDNGEYGLTLDCDTAYVSGLTFVAGRIGSYYNGDEYKSRGFAKVTASGAVVTNCVFRDLRGRDRKYGCGLDISKGTVVDCLFANIASLSSGGAMPQGGSFIIQGGVVDRTRIVECRALDSSSATGAGGLGDIIGVWGSGVLRNSLVTRCTSEHDTPIYVSGHLENCTIVANTNLQAVAKEKFWYAAGLIVNGGSVTNCIVVDNWSVLGGAVSNIYNTAGAAGIGYTLVNDRAGDATFATAANHNRAVSAGASIFRNPGAGNYTLSGKSPAVNAGLLFDWMETASDLAGKPRVAGHVPDLGCYEAVAQKFIVRLR